MNRKGCETKKSLKHKIGNSVTYALFMCAQDFHLSYQMYGQRVCGVDIYIKVRLKKFYPSMIL